MSKTSAVSNELYTSQSAALTALIDEKGRDYTQDEPNTYYWKSKGDKFGDGPYRLLQTKGGKWIIL